MKVFAVLLAILFWCAVNGCASAEFLVREGAQAATVVALYEMNATPDDAQDMHATALDVVLMVQGGAPSGEIKADLLKLIQHRYDDPLKRMVVLQLADSLTDLVIETLNQQILPVPADISKAVIAAATGVQDGADLYLLAVSSVTPAPARDPPGAGFMPSPMMAMRSPRDWIRSAGPGSMLVGY